MFVDQTEHKKEHETSENKPYLCLLIRQTQDEQVTIANLEEHYYNEENKLLLWEDEEKITTE